MEVAFWTEHKQLWTDEAQWFKITSKSNEKALSQVLDRCIMRQKAILNMMIPHGFVKDFEQHTHLTANAIKLYGTEWPSAVVTVDEEDEKEQGIVEEDPESDEVETKDVDDGLWQGKTKQELADDLELESQGQQRYWFRQNIATCCLDSWTSSSEGSACGRSRHCPYCNAQLQAEKDRHHGLFH